MEDISINESLQVNVGRQSPLRPSGGSFKSSFSGKSTPRSSPSHRRLNANRTHRREVRINGGVAQWFRNSRIVYWLLLITIWAYIGFYVQSRWAHEKEDFPVFEGNIKTRVAENKQNPRRDVLEKPSNEVIKNGTVKNPMKGVKKVMIPLLKKPLRTLSKSRKTEKKRKRVNVPKRLIEVQSETEVVEEEIPRTNSTFGLLFGPFGAAEDRILEWSPNKRTGTCDRKGQLARLVWSRRFVLVFHELSMTGAPLSMMELATEFLSCGATVSVVALSRKGGLLPELKRRRITVLDDKLEESFKTARKADLVIAGSAVCASWLDRYITENPAGASRVLWWIMENRKEYFDRAKIVLDRVKTVVFLSKNQSEGWLSWCAEEKIKLRSPPATVQLSINDELAFAAGISCSLTTPSSSPEKMLEKRMLLRNFTRKEMNLTDNDVLVMSLSSINPGKGQLLLVESVNVLLDKGHPQKMNKSRASLQEQTKLAANHKLRSLLQITRKGRKSKARKLKQPMLHKNDLKVLSTANVSVIAMKPNGSEVIEEPLFNKGGRVLKLLIGSVGSKSNKIPYVKEILNFVSSHPNMANSVLWTPSSTRVAALYSAADIYVMNSQGIGETFGRVTIEAMAFGLPVLGTDAGGTKEIVEHNVTGLLHPVGHQGSVVLAENLKFLIKNPSVRAQMGMNGRKKAKQMYLKRHMYKSLGEVVYKSMM